MNTKMMPTILGSAGRLETPERAQQRVEAERVLERMRILVWMFCDAYRAGEIATLDNLCRLAVKVTEPSKKYPDDISGGLDRQKLLGAMLEHAMAGKPPKRGRGNKGMPQRLRDAVQELVKTIQKEEGLPTNRGSDAPAFKRAAGLLRAAGIAVTESQIEAWTYPRKSGAKARKPVSASKRKSANAG